MQSVYRINSGVGGSVLVIVVCVIYVFLQFFGDCEALLWFSSHSPYYAHDLSRGIGIGIPYSIFLGGLLVNVITDGGAIPTNNHGATENVKVITIHNNGTSSQLISVDNDNVNDGEDDKEPRENRKFTSDKEKRLQLLKHIQKLDRNLCFPKVLCGIHVGETSSGINSHFIKSYIQLMRMPDEDSSEDSTPSLSNKKDALSLFLLRSGILRSKNKKPPETSQSASSSEEEYENIGSPEEPYKSSIEKKNDALKNLLSKRKLDTRDDWTSVNINKNMKGDKPSDPYRFVPVLHLSPGPTARQPTDDETGSVTSQIGSLVSSLVPWVKLSFGTDSFEKDPFFKGGSAKPSKREEENWQKDLDKLVYLMKMKKEAEMKRKRTKKTKKNPRVSLDESHNSNSTSSRSFRDLKIDDDEMMIYSTAVDIGKKLKDVRQCDYLYNGCPVPYAEIIKIISSIRKDIKQSEESADELSKEIFEYSEIIKAAAANKQKLPIKTHTQQNKKGSSGAQRIRKPMTQISHTLPNGEKVEINVQLSGKDENFGQEQEEEEVASSLSLEAQEYQPQDEPDLFAQQHEQIIEEKEEEVEEPAISASYELADEKQSDEDFRRPTPIEIFQKLSLKAGQKLTTAAPTTTSTKKTSTIKKLKPKPPLTTTLKPSSSRKPTKMPTRQPSVKPRITKPTPAPLPTKKKKPTAPIITTIKTTTAATTTTKRPKATTKSVTQRKKPTTKITTTTTMRPFRRTTTKKIRVTTSTTRTSKATTTVEPLRRSTLSRRNKPISSSSRISTTTTTTTEIPVPTTVISSTTTDSNYQHIQYEPISNESSDDDILLSNNMKFDVPISTSTPRTTTTTQTTTPSALAMFTKSFMDEVMEEMYHTELAKPYPTMSPAIKKYSISKKQDSTDSYFHSPDTTPGPDPSNTFNIPYSTESDSSEIHLFTHTVEEGTHLIPFEKEAGTTTTVSKIFNLNDRNGSEVNEGKRRIKYKNPKLPHLVLMNISSIEHANLKHDTIPYQKRQRPRPPKPHYSIPKYSNRTSTTIQPAFDYLSPYVIDHHHHQGSVELPYWVPGF